MGAESFKDLSEKPIRASICMRVKAVQDTSGFQSAMEVGVLWLENGI